MTKDVQKFLPVTTQMKPPVTQAFAGYELKAFLRTHCGHSRDSQTYRWGNDVDVAYVDEQEKLLALLLHTENSLAAPTSYWVLPDGRWLKITTKYEPGIFGLQSTIEGGWTSGNVQS